MIRSVSPIVLIAWSLAVVIASSSADGEGLSPSSLGEIQSISNKILQLCPPQDCFVLGVGRSPTPFIANLQDEAQDYAYNIPLSNFRHNPVPEKMGHWGIHEEILKNSIAPLDHNSEQRLFEHLDRFLPKFSPGKPKKVLVVDYSTSGYSIFGFQKYLERYYAAKRMQVQIGSLSIVANGKLQKVKSMAPRYGVNHFDTIELEEGGKLDQALHESDFDEYAEYPHFDILMPTENWRREKYVKFKKDLLNLKRTCLLKKLDAMANTPIPK